MASDGESDEDFVSYGTPLEPLEEDEPLKKPLPLHEQTVKDEKGRYQRFHGAFTGGFSAGYFNTVGTKEGWAPSTFVSSRQQKAGKQNARPEDFMDEEDFGEHGIAPADISTSQEFTSSRRDATREKARAVNAQAALIPGDTLLEQLIAPTRSSMGVELLKRMGWKEGQGVGPRVKRKAGRQQTGSRAHGCVLPPAGSEDSQGDDDDDDDEEFALAHVTFAPKDVTPVDFNPRVGVQGLGYRGLNPGLALPGRGATEHLDLFRPLSETRSRLFGDKRGSRRGGVAGQAFGVGAMEDDDDEEVYHKDSMSRYDTELGGEEPGDGLYGWTAPRQYMKKREKSRDVSYLGKILEGFTVAQKRPEDQTIYPPPSLPRDYRPVHHFGPALDASGLSGVSPALAEALRVSRGHMVSEEPQHGGRHQLDSGQRRNLLGEDALRGPSSVMELLKPEDRQRLLGMRRSSGAPPLPNSTLTPQDAVRPAAEDVSSSSGLRQQQEALTMWKGVQTSSQTFRPFEQNPSKQARYELYLGRLQQGDRDGLEQSLDPAMTEWERSRERDEFVRASILYRPSSSSLSSRFTRARSQEDQDTVEVQRDQEGDVDDKQAAVNMKMFGELTRETFEWHPDKLLCKRFNIPDPYSGSGLVGLPKVKRDKFSVFNFLTVTETMTPPKPPEAGKRSRWDVSVKEEKEDPLSELLVAARNQTGIKVEGASCTSSSSTEQQTDDSVTKRTLEDKEEQEEQEESRPPMDLFKAIFAISSDDKSSSSSEGESDDDDDEEEVKDVKEEQMDPQPLNLFSVTSSSVTSSSITHKVSSQNSAQEKEEFGPKLPPPADLTRPGSSSSLCSPGRRSKDKKKKKKKKKEHKHKKEKKKKKPSKNKAKQQKKRSRKDGDSEDQAAQESTQELLKRLKTMQSQATW